MNRVDIQPKIYEYKIQINKFVSKFYLNPLTQKFETKYLLSNQNETLILDDKFKRKYLLYKKKYINLKNNNH